MNNWLKEAIECAIADANLHIEQMPSKITVTYDERYPGCLEICSCLAHNSEFISCISDPYIIDQLHAFTNHLLANGYRVLYLDEHDAWNGEREFRPI
jgi:hypothetical protein